MGAAAGPALAAAAAVGLLFAVRARSAIRAVEADEPAVDTLVAESPWVADATAKAAGAVAVLGALAAVFAGLEGVDVAVPFAFSGGVLACGAVAAGRLDVRTIVRSIPLAGLAVIAIAVIASEPNRDRNRGCCPDRLPQWAGCSSRSSLVVGLLLSPTTSPAAAFGAVWLVGAHPATVVDLPARDQCRRPGDPQPLVATILARAVGHRHGVPNLIDALSPHGVGIRGGGSGGGDPGAGARGAMTIGSALGLAWH